MEETGLLVRHKQQKYISKFSNIRDQMDLSEKEQRNFFHVGLVTGDE